jgi:hypothetical protein
VKFRFIGKRPWRYSPRTIRRDLGFLDSEPWQKIHQKLRRFSGGRDAVRRLPRPCHHAGIDQDNVTLGRDDIDMAGLVFALIRPDAFPKKYASLNRSLFVFLAEFRQLQQV